jgi:hypothetical protein
MIEIRKSDQLQLETERLEAQKLYNDQASSLADCKVSAHQSVTVSSSKRKALKSSPVSSFNNRMVVADLLIDCSQQPGRHTR